MTDFRVREVLENFCKALGQKINEDKSHIIFYPNTPNDLRDLFQETINVRESSSLGTYLGNPISLKRPKEGRFNLWLRKVR